MFNWDNPTGSATGTKAVTADKLPTVTKETMGYDALPPKPTQALPKANLASAVSVNDKRVVKRHAFENAIAYLTTSVILVMRNIGLAVMEKTTAPERQIYQARQVYDESVHCYIEGTSVLTPAGWIDFRMITPDTLVYQYGKNGKLEITPHLGVTKDPFDGHLLRIYGEHYESVVTPNHKCVVYTRSPNGLTMTKMTAEALSQDNALSKVDLPLRCTQTYVGEEQIEQSLIGMAIYLHRVDTCNNNDTVVLSFTAGVDIRPCLLTIAALTKANVTFTHTVVTNTHFVTIPSALLKTHAIKKATTDQGLQQVYGEAVRWLLGTNIPIDIKYLTLSVSVWLTVAGYNTCDHGDTFDINSKLCVDGGTLSIEPYRYEGFVYSVGVPSCMIVTRYKGNVSISGNTWT